MTEVLLQVENLTKSYGDLVLFESINLSIHKDQKVALIARNGTGKTSLLNIIAGIETADSGAITTKNDLRVGYLMQDPFIDENHTVLQEVFASSNETVAAIKDYEAAIAGGNEEELQKATDNMDRVKGWDYETKVKQILSELKINEYNKPIKALSGGQKKRVALANVLINAPDLLIMDEPTNHLDLEMIEWLEDYLIQTKCALFMVTHDRYFLNRVCNEIYEMDELQVFNYKGNYEYFLEKRDERIQNRNTEIEKARSLYKRELDWIRRSPSARTTKAKYRVDAFSEIEDVASQKIRRDQVRINVNTARLGKKILNLHAISKSYGDHKVVTELSYLFKPYEKVGVIGNNGTGKTTLLNLLSQNQAPDSGTFEVGETVVFGYYRQEGIEFNNNQKVIDFVSEIAEVVTLSDGKKLSISSFLNHFLFPPKMQQSFISKLSGGEKRRLYLLTVLMKSPNFLLLDEPTNDLDILTLNVLEDFLMNFSGCVVLVSHDRYFMDKIIDHMFVFGENGNIKDFPGNYTDYRIKKKKPSSNSAGKQETKTTAAPKQPQKKTKLTYKEERELEQLELDLENLSTEKETIHNELNSGKLSGEELTRYSKRLAELLEEADEKEMRWLELSELKDILASE